MTRLEEQWQGPSVMDQDWGTEERRHTTTGRAKTGGSPAAAPSQQPADSPTTNSIEVGGGLGEESSPSSAALVPKEEEEEEETVQLMARPVRKVAGGIEMTHIGNVCVLVVVARFGWNIFLHAVFQPDASVPFMLIQTCICC